MFLLGTLLSANAQVPNYVPSNGLIGYFGFNNNANDDIGTSTPISNNASLTTDRFGISNSAYYFNNSNVIKYNNSSNPLFKIGNINKSFSINCWVNTSNNGNGMILGGFGWGYMVELTNSNNIKFAYISANLNETWVSYTSNASIIKNTWQMVTIKREGNSNSIYIDGVLDTTFASKPDIRVFTNYNCWFGANGQDNNNYLTGKIDDVGLWNRGLTQQEISVLYNNCQLEFSSQPTNQSSSINNQAQFSSLASDTTASYQWQSNHANMGWSNVPSNSFYSGVTTKKLTVNSIKLNNHEQLFRVIATKNTCKDTSVVAMLTVNDTCITNVYDTIVTSTTDTLYIKVNTSNINNPVYNTIKVYPNPSSTQVIIDNGNYSTMGSHTAKIVNASGQQVFQSVINQQQFVIDAKTMGGAGVYTLYITDANNKVVGVKKIVLQ
jgi:hypothetical protein